MMSKKVIRISELLAPKLQKIWNDREHAHIIITSGRAGTKSSWVGMKAPFEIVNDQDCSIVVMRKFHNKLKKTVYKEVLRGMNRLGLNKSKFKITVSPMEIQHKKSGNTIYFTGNDSIDDTKGMIDEQKPIKYVVLDELTEFFDKGDGEDEIANIEATFVRGNDDQFQMIYLFNPPKNGKAPIMKWLEKMEAREDTKHIHIDYRDIPESWLGKKLIAAAEMMKKMDELMYRWVWLGLCTGLSELIYYMFSEDRHVREVPKDIDISYIGVGVDYGQMNATTYEAFGISFSEKCIQGMDEYYHSGRESGHQKSPSEYAKDFKAFIDNLYALYGHKPTYCFIDPSAAGLKEEIRRLCPAVIFPTVNNTVDLGISRVQKLFAFMRIFLSPKQKNLISEMYQYGYDPDSIDKGKEKPKKENDHCQDAMRYTVMGFWKYLVNILPFLREE